jgi:hypothetical protein
MWALCAQFMMHQRSTTSNLKNQVNGSSPVKSGRLEHGAAITGAKHGELELDRSRYCFRTAPMPLNYRQAAEPTHPAQHLTCATT